MSCFICGRGSCCTSFHSRDEQERYAPVIELLETAFDKAAEMRKEIKDQERENEQDD